MTASLSEALRLMREGLPSFSCLADKHPATPHGFKDATAEPDQLRESLGSLPSRRSTSEPEPQP